MSSRHIPLEVDWVEIPLAITVLGQRVTGTARANWCAVEMAITYPIAFLSRKFNGAGWAFAMCAIHHPEVRLAHSGQLTAKGIQKAESLLSDVFLDWHAVSRHEIAVDEQARRTQQQLDELERDFDARRRLLLKKRLGLRRAFFAGELSQGQYQHRRKEVRKEVLEIDRWKRWDQGAAKIAFADWTLNHCGWRVDFEDVNGLLLEAAVVGPVSVQE